LLQPGCELRLYRIDRADNVGLAVGCVERLAIAGDARRLRKSRFQSLTLNNGAQIQIVGPVLLVLGNGFNVNGGTVGSAATPSFLALEIFAGGLTLNNGAKIYGYAAVPSGTVSINSNTQLVGGIAADQLTINNDGKLILSPPGN
jgi:hypothetical protein